ncbi:MAG TPA: hypothetical protein VK988_08115 [Acidimicrobiales bacterium]|nr:hypothetical protein [Acidimicrobiales bacterium]
MRKTIAAMAVVVGVLGGSAGLAAAEKPGPGDKQCVPGKQGNPHPGFKAGVCPNPGK